MNSSQLEKLKAYLSFLENKHLYSEPEREALQKQFNEDA